MASRTLAATLSLLTLSFFSSILTDNAITGMSIREKCECVKETDRVNWSRVTGFEVKEPEVLCSKVQIIMMMGQKASCLNPKSKLGKGLLKCWKGIGFNEKKKKVCFTPKKAKTKKKRKQKRH